MTICAFGDSITYAGYIENSWCNLIKRHLEQTKQEEISFYNLGINGNTSDDIIKRFIPETSARNPDTIIFAYGVNDSAYFLTTGESLVNSENFEKNTLELIHQAKNFTNKIIFIGLVLGNDSKLKPYPESTSGKCYDLQKVKQYDELIKKVAGATNCKYIYLLDKLDDKDFLDGLHPNESGHMKMFNSIYL